MNECKRFSGGKEMCEVMWGNSFNYTDGGSNLCLTPTEAANNKLVVNEIFKDCEGVVDAAAAVAVAGASFAAAAAVAAAVSLRA
jgi:hypothetical protein